MDLAGVQNNGFCKSNVLLHTISDAERYPFLLKLCDSSKSSMKLYHNLPNRGHYDENKSSQCPVIRTRPTMKIAYTFFVLQFVYNGALLKNNRTRGHVLNCFKCKISISLRLWGSYTPKTLSPESCHQPKRPYPRAKRAMPFLPPLKNHAHIALTCTILPQIHYFAIGVSYLVPNI